MLGSENPYASRASIWFNEEQDRWLAPSVMLDDSMPVEPGKNSFPSPKEIKSRYPKPEGDYCSNAVNECAIRMSIAFQKCRLDISGSSKFRKTHTHGEDPIIHQPSAKALADWLHNALKYPKKYKKDKGEWTESDFLDKDGIIYFLHEEYGGSGPGHIDVIYNGKIGSGFYDNKEIWFWEYKNGEYV